jgi:hypothetical protein
MKSAYAAPVDDYVFLLHQESKIHERRDLPDYADNDAEVHAQSSASHAALSASRRSASSRSRSADEHLAAIRNSDREAEFAGRRDLLPLYFPRGA